LSRARSTCLPPAKFSELDAYAPLVVAAITDLVSMVAAKSQKRAPKLIGGSIYCCMHPDLLAEALKLSLADRLRLIEVLWSTVSEEDLPVTPEEGALLDARLADLDANPGDQSHWSEVKARLEQRRR
jgi:putative addiction module component (TIGR02574 family)